MNNKRVIIGSLVTVVAAGTIGVNVTSAYFSGDAARRDVGRSSFERKNSFAFEDVIKNNVIHEGDMTDSDLIALAQQLRIAGKYDQAQMILKDARIESSLHHAREDGARAQVRNAVETGNWTEYQEATAGKSIAKKIDTEEKFNMLIEARELRKEGRFEEAQSIMRDLGLAYHK